MVQNRAKADALKITSDQMRIEMENKQLEGAARLGRLIGDGRPMDESKLDEALVLSTQFNLPQSAIEPLISKYNEHQITTGRSEFIKRLGQLPADLRTPFGMVQGAPTKQQWDDLGVSEEIARRRPIAEREEADALAHQRRLEVVRAGGEIRENVANINAAGRLNPTQTRMKGRISDGRAYLAKIKAAKAAGQARWGTYPGEPIDYAIKAQEALVNSYQEDLQSEGVTIGDDGEPVFQGQGGQPTAAPTADANGNINVVSPDGRAGMIPASKWAEAQGKGYTIAK
jgi:hypothetical protein